MDTAVHQHAAPAAPCALPLVLRLRPVVELTEEQFFALCQLNPELWIERNAKGDLEIMTPVGGETGERESEINGQLWAWARRDETGRTYSSSTGFRLPNGATRAPDAAWVLRSRVDALPAEQRQQFLPLCPDFVLELRSPSDALPELQAKMAEYVANGARLGWLVDPEQRHVYVYRPNAPVERLDHPDAISGDPVLPRFALDLRAIW